MSIGRSMSDVCAIVLGRRISFISNGTCSVWLAKSNETVLRSTLLPDGDHSPQSLRWGKHRSPHFSWNAFLHNCSLSAMASSWSLCSSYPTHAQCLPKSLRVLAELLRSSFLSARHFTRRSWWSPQPCPLACRAAKEVPLYSSSNFSNGLHSATTIDE